jgi:two-component system, OmpR family, sensor histidine kinase BaeS
MNAPGTETARQAVATAAPVGPARAADRRRSLAFRLGLLLAVTVAVVLLLVGVLVNRVVSGNYEAVLTELQQQRLDDAAQTVADRLARPAGPARAQAFVMRLANQIGGQIQVIGTDGTTLAAFGREPDDAVSYSTPVAQDGQVVATLHAKVPAVGVDRGFLRLFNLTLAVAGIVSVLGIVLVATWIAGRLTRPLHDVADAARRLEAGDPTARASGGDDQESAELADAFNAMADRLERSEMLRRRAASDIAHDLATPATVLESQLQAMVDGVIPTDAANLEAARSTAAALGGVVADIGDLARSEAAPLQARPEAIDLAVALPDIAASLDGARRARDIRLEVSAGPAAVAWADAGHLARAIRNVVANAIAHSPSGGTVTVAAERLGGAARVRVTDQGPGIAPGDVEHVFERFYRADAARATDPATGRPAGLGLGLTIARELLAANGGRIAVERTGPSGTTFLIEVPAAA